MAELVARLRELGLAELQERQVRVDLDILMARQELAVAVDVRRL